jgi:hypothetical protein
MSIDTQTVWKVQGTELTMNGKPIFLKGLCYSPTPWGCATDPNRIGDWFDNTCRSLWGSAAVAGQRGDLEMMKSARLNHLRTYFWWEWWWPASFFTKESIADWIKREGWNEDTNWPRFDHTEFLDCCNSNDIHVMIGLPVNSSAIFAPNGDYGVLGPQQKQLYVDTAKQIGLRYGKHPAVMGLCVGNEQNQPGPGRNGNPRFWAALGEMAQAFKQNAPDKVTMVAFQNDPALFDTQVGEKTVKQVFKENFQIYGLNIYGDPSGSLQNFKAKVVEPENGNYACPLIVSEWGVGGGKNIENPRYQEWIKSANPKRPDGATPGPLEGPPFGMADAREFTPDEFNQKTSDLAQYFEAIKIARDFVVGAEYFSWSDEWWKNVTPEELIELIKSKSLPLDEWGRYKEPGTGYLKFPTYLGKQEASASPDWPEEFWGLYSIHPQDGGITWPDGILTNHDILENRPTWTALEAAYASVP